MEQEYPRQRSPGLIDRLNSGVGTLQNARAGLALARFLVGQGARAAGGALAGATSGVWIPIVAVVIFIFLFTFFIVGFGGTPGGAGIPGGNISPTISPPGGGASITPFPSGSGSNACTQRYEGTGSCLVGNLKNYFGGNETTSLIASLICQAESGSNPFVPPNTKCLTGESCDYSIGLFQINLLPADRCPGAFSNYRCQPPPPFCIIGDAGRLNNCRERLSDPAENINKAVQVSQNGIAWTPWGTWLHAAPGRLPVRDILTQCGIQY